MEKKTEPFGLYVIEFVGWMICWGMFPILIYFSSNKKDIVDLLIVLGIIAIAFFAFIGAITLYHKITDTQDAKDIKEHVSSILKTKLGSTIITWGVVIAIASTLIIGFFGTTEIDKPFNRFSYSAIYKANVSKNKNLQKSEQIDVWIVVDRKLFGGKTYELDYIYYKGHDIEFDEGEYYLQIGKYVPVSFYLDDREHEWYIELSTKKVSDPIEVYPD